MEADLSGTLLEFALLFITISAISLLFRRFRLPIVLAPVLFGIFVRYTPLAAHLQGEEFRDALDILANFGALFLLFYIGLQIDFKGLKQFGRPIIRLTLYSVFIPFIFGFILIWGLGYGLMLALVIGMTRVPVAEAVVVPILDEFGLVNTKVGQFIIGPGVLDDVVEVALISIVSIWLAGKTGVVADVSPVGVFAGVVLFMVVAIAGYRWLIPFFGCRVDHSPHITMVFCVAVLLFYAGLSEYSKLGLVIGALTAGMVIRPWLDSLKNAAGDRIIDAIQLISYGFIGIFFFYQVGLMVDPTGIIEDPILVLLLFAATSVGKLISALLLVRDGSLTRREAMVVGVGLDVQMTTELIIAQMLFSAGAIDSTLYTAIVGASSLMMIFVPTTLVILLRNWGDELRKS